MSGTKYIWIFNGAGARFPSGAFQSREDAEGDIKRYGLSGMLTKYPVGEFVLSWAIEQGFFQPDEEFLKNKSEKMQTFTSAYMEHYHYEDGSLD